MNWIIHLSSNGNPTLNAKSRYSHLNFRLRQRPSCQNGTRSLNQIYVNMHMYVTGICEKVEFMIDVYTIHKSNSHYYELSKQQMMMMMMMSLNFAQHKYKY